MSYLALAIIAGLAAVERKGFLQAMLSRPVALAPITGWVLSDLNAGLLLAAPLELLWLGAVNMGAALPLHEALATTAITGGAILAARAAGTSVTPELALLAFLTCAPLALVGRAADERVERWNERLAKLADSELKAGHLRSAMRANLYGLAFPFLVAAVLAPLGAAVCAFALPVFTRTFPGAAPSLRLGFFAFSAIACAAGAKAMRARAARAFFYAALGSTLVLGVLVAGVHP